MRITIALLMLAVSPALVHADAVLDWNGFMVTTVTGQNPFAQARYAAITQLAVFEAVNAITGDYKPYLGHISAPPDASPEAAAVSAAHAVLKQYFPNNGASLDAARDSSLAAIPNGPGKDAGIAAGEAAAHAMIDLRANDGSEPPEFYSPPTADPGEWQPTPSCPSGAGLFLHWRNVTPFGIRRASQFRSEPPPRLKTGRYRRDYNEVKEVGDIDSAARPPDRAEVALYFGMTSGVNIWNTVAAQLSVARGLSISENARVFALVNMALSDAMVAVFDTKYHYNFWRPETAIRAGDTDGNPGTEPDTSYLPFVTSPCFPSYPSAHGSASYAGRKVLERIFGRCHPPIVLATNPTDPAVPKMTFEYTDLRHITDDIDDARVYGGIHFRFDQEAGARQGLGVGNYVHKHNLRPARRGHHAEYDDEEDDY